MIRKKILTVACCIMTTVVFAQNAGDEDKEMLNRGKQRDQQAIDEALHGWWPASMKDHDERIQWWQQARFGMFIHWGVYSLPGGEWKGHKVEGYAEHLMRKEKIPRAEYLALAHEFNPVHFNAEEWAKHAKEAGMKYMIITSKHHDGFAMFDSKVTDYNIMQQTPFKRDPMVELSAACHKYGIKFGFYYSHAFDWEHPDAPGNDWEYNNPGGDKGLYGGVNWFDIHPELLPKAQKYVDEKAIPQIKELIAKYHPDILWFDTPSKLPLSENLRILKAIREVDRHVVVNGRLARTAEQQFGDYQNTADRPLEFYPVTGNWEAIPTTNESYGYHKFDSSHKPVSAFVQLLAKAASRGGNLLMNIGPKGDGTFDNKDLNILKGIGKWMQTNGESIYGTVASPLPLQSWGVSTVKGNTLYLHVFKWPQDHKLYVGGLLSDPAKVYLLEGKKQLTATRANEKDVLIQLPAQAPDTMNTVIAIELKAPLKTDAVRYFAANIPVQRLLAYDAQQHGEKFGYGDGKAGKYYVQNWKEKDQWLSWTFRSTAPAVYNIEMKYIAGGQAGGSFMIEAGAYKKEFKIVKKGNDTQVLTDQLGTISLPAGVCELAIKPVSIDKTELMKLLELQLTKSGADMPAASATNPKPISVSQVFADAEKQTQVMLAAVATVRDTNTNLVAPRTLANDRLIAVPSKDWTSGFFAGELWMLYDYTHQSEWKQKAEEYTARLEKEKFNGGTHDMGFKIYCSYGTGYRITHDAAYKDVIVQSARTLATRFNPKVGCIRSWDHHRDTWAFPVIIDNMMNLELLFAATRLTGDSSFYRIAVSHANTTLKNHFRADYSSYHVVDYDTVTGQVIKKTTHQGYANESAWARGQGWALYGFTMCYRETHNPVYLKQAENVAAFILHHPRLPADKIPYWDFDAPGIPNEPRDASAAAVIASGLYELAQYSKNKKEYLSAAGTILQHLTAYYRSSIGENKGFILLHSTGAKPSNSEVDAPLSYADYYYLEALLRKKR